MSFVEADLLILGGSMLGIELVYQVRRQSKRPVRVAVVDRQSRHPYIPLCHEHLCGRLRPDESTLETARYVAADPNSQFIEGEIVSFDPHAHEVTLGNGDRVRGRVVVVALGSRLEAPAAVPGSERFQTLKLGPENARARESLRSVLDGATGVPPRLLVVGGGISGVELAAEFAHLHVERPPGWAAPAVTLVHRGERLLPALSSGAGRRAARALEAQGVDLRLRTTLTELRADGARVVEGVEAGDESLDLPCAAAFWAGGVAPPPILAKLGLPLTDEGWLCVGPSLQCFPTPEPSNAEIFAGGDAARIIGGGGEWPTMQRAIECIWQAKVLAKNTLALLAEPVGYPEGVPPLTPHHVREDFPHGVSMGARSMIAYGQMAGDFRGASVWFRRWLMRQYMARYRS